MSTPLTRRAVLRASLAALALPAALAVTAAQASGTDPRPGLLAQVEFMVEDYGGGTGLPEVGLTLDDVPQAFLETIAAGLRRLA